MVDPFLQIHGFVKTYIAIWIHIKTLGNFVVCFFPPLSVYQVCAQLQNMWVGKKQQTSLNTMQASNFLKYTLVKTVRLSMVAAQRE